MSLDRAIAHGRERRRRYYGSAAFDPSCRPGGDCPWCAGNRRHQTRKAEAAARESIREWGETGGGARSAHPPEAGAAEGSDHGG